MKKKVYSYLQKEALLGNLSQNTFKTQGIIFISVLVLLLFFKPFFLAAFPLKPRIILIVGYGVCACFGFAISYSIFAPYNKTKWTKLLDFGMFFTCFILIWLFIYGYSILNVKFLFEHVYNIPVDLSFPDRFFQYLLFYTIGTGSIIFLIIRAYDIYISHDKFKENLHRLKSIEIPNNQAKKNYKNKRRLLLIGKNKNESLSLDINQFVYAKSEGHYIKIIYIHEKTKKTKFYTLRNKISVIESQLSEFDTILRCHQSYIINLHYLKSVTGNKNKAYARLVYSENIPISNTYFEYLNKKTKEKTKEKTKPKTN